jgi:hypothetical protein
MLWTLQGHNSKEILPRMRQHFVDANIFIDTNILSMRVFCQCQHFANASILSMPIFCRRQYFVDANILSAPIFLICAYIFLKF